MSLRENLRAFRHEMDATKDDVSGILVLGGLLRKPERIPLIVAQGNDLLPLVVVGQDEEFFSQILFYGLDGVDNLFVFIPVGQCHCLVKRFSPQKIISPASSSRHARVMFRLFPNSTAKAVGREWLSMTGNWARAAFWTNS